MIAMLTRSDIPRLLQAGVKTEFFNAYNTAPAGLYEQITTEVPSEKAEEVYARLGANPRLREWRDERAPKALLEHGFTIKNKDREATIEVDKNALDDDQYGQVIVRARTMGAGVKADYDYILSGIIEEGHTTLCYDGQNYFDTDHSEGESGTQSNYTSTGLALTIPNAKTVISAMQLYKDDRGRLAGINPTHIMVPTALEWTAREIFDPQGTGDTNANTSLKGRLKVVVNPRLTSTTARYVMDLSKAVKPFIYQNRKPLTRDEDDTKLFNKKVIQMGVYARFAFGYCDRRLSYKAVA